MKKITWIILGFIAIVKIPWGINREYRNVDKYDVCSAGFYRLHLEDGKEVLVPIQWTVIQEK